MSASMIREIEDKLDKAEYLLEQAMDHMDNTHGYDSEIYQAIQAYFKEEEEEEEENE